MDTTTATELWYRQVYDDKIGGCSIMGAVPTLRCTPAQNEDRPRVLVCATSAECTKLSQANPLAPNSPSKVIYEIALQHGLERMNLEFVSEMVNFWEAFFKKEDFVGYSDNALTLPHLLLTTGQMRDHDASGRGDTVGMFQLLSDIAGKWNIPVKRIHHYNHGNNRWIP